MAHSHGSNTKRIWYVFVLLSVVTIVEVVLGIFKPEVLYMNNLFKMNLLNWIFIVLTLVKAYYIMWAFMHLEGEKASVRWSVVAPLTFLVAYLILIILIEGDYIFDTYSGSYYKWIF